MFLNTATVSIFSFKRHVLNHIYNQPPPQSSPWLHFGFGLRLQDFDTVSNIYMYTFFVLSFNDNNYSITVTLTFNGVLWRNSPPPFPPPSNYRSFKNCRIIKKIKKVVGFLFFWIKVRRSCNPICESRVTFSYWNSSFRAFLNLHC